MSLNDNLVAFYKFEEVASPSPSEIGGSGFDQLWSDAAFVPCDVQSGPSTGWATPARTVGVVGNALNLNSAWTQGRTAAGFHLGRSNFNWAGKVYAKIVLAGTDPVITLLGGSPINDIYTLRLVSVMGGVQFQWIVEGANAGVPATLVTVNSQTVTGDAWHTVSCGVDFDNDVIFVQVDCSTVHTTAFTYDSISEATPECFHFGREGQSYPYSGVYLDAMGLWSRVLSSTENTEICAGIQPPFAGDNVTFTPTIAFSANLLDTGRAATFRDVPLDSAKPTAVFWYHENRLYASFAGKTYCRDVMAGQSAGWTDCGYGYVNSAFVVSRFAFPHMALLAANLRPIAYGDRTDVVSLTHRNLTWQNLNTDVVPMKRIEYRPMDGAGIARERRKWIERFRVWGEITRNGASEMGANARQIGTLTCTTETGYQEIMPLYEGLCNADEIANTMFSMGMVGELITMDLDLFENVVDATVLQSLLEYVPET